MADGVQHGSRRQLADVVPTPVVLPGCGHNAHVERPDLVAGLLVA